MGMSIIIVFFGIKLILSLSLFLSFQTIAVVCSFPTIASAVTTTVEVLQTGIPVARVEFLDELSLS